MTQRESYKTKQRELIEEKALEQKGEFTIKELFSKLLQYDKTIGLTTVYRSINTMTKNHVLIKAADQDGTLHYRVSENCNKKGHCILRCESCGKLVHTDCMGIGMLLRHLLNRHDFKIDSKSVTISGICNNCRTQENHGEKK